MLPATCAVALYVWMRGGVLYMKILDPYHKKCACLVAVAHLMPYRVLPTFLFVFFEVITFWSHLIVRAV